MAETILVLPPGDTGEITLTEKVWVENNYTVEGVGQSVKERAMELGVGMAMEINRGVFGGVTIKWYPTGND